jgi:uncharacterized membrane protein
MFGRKRGVADTVAESAGSVVDYVDPLVKDEKLRRKVAAALAAGLAARNQLHRRRGLLGLVARIESDPVLRGQLLELAAQLKASYLRAESHRRHTVRKALLLAGGAGVVVAAMKLRERASSNRSDEPTSKLTTVDAEIEVGVPVTTAYNQWTQFEEFPRFMDGVDEVKQLDDTLLHWAATVAGRHAEWDAKIVEQEPDRRIAWESIDGKHTRGTVTFEQTGPERSRVRLHMSYAADGAAELVGSAMGLDSRRVRGDLERFRELVEGRGTATGAWRGEIGDGVEKRSG